MGSELVNSSLPISYSEFFYKCLPYYLSIGMPNNEFWNSDCQLTKCYREADKYKQQRLNQLAWLNGLYNYEALCDVSPILRAFAKRGTKPIKYSSAPYALTPEEQKREQEQKSLQMQAKVKAWAARINKRRGEKNE